MVNPFFTYRESDAIIENSAFYISEKDGTVLTNQYITEDKNVLETAWSVHVSNIRVTRLATSRPY